MTRKQLNKHQRIWVKNHGPIPEGYHIHHIDGNNKNNDLDNLICVSRKMHGAFHLDRWENLGLAKDNYAAIVLGTPASTPWNKGVRCPEHSKRMKNNQNPLKTYSINNQSRFLGVSWHITKQLLTNTNYGNTN